MAALLDQLSERGVSRSRPVLAFCAALVLVLGFPAMASASKPETFLIDIDEPFATDPFLTEACGVEVETSAKGRLRFTILQNDVGPVFMLNISVQHVAQSEHGMVRFRDVGLSQVRLAPDGTATLSHVGQIPVPLEEDGVDHPFKGIVVIDLSSGEIVHGPTAPWDIDRVCRALAG